MPLNSSIIFSDTEGLCIVYSSKLSSLPQGSVLLSHIPVTARPLESRPRGPLPQKADGSRRSCASPPRTRRDSNCPVVSTATEMTARREGGGYYRGGRGRGRLARGGAGLGVEDFRLAPLACRPLSESGRPQLPPSTPTLGGSERRGKRHIGELNAAPSVQGRWAASAAWETAFEYAFPGILCASHGKGSPEFPPP